MIDKRAVLHIPMSQYAYGTDEQRVTIRLRAARGNLKECILFYGDRACRQTPVIFTPVKMELEAQTELFDFFRAELVDAYKRICYYFSITDGQEQLLYYGDQFATTTVDDRSEYFQLPFNHRADIVNPPEWAKDAIIYNIFPDSFATGKGFLSNAAIQKIVNGQVVSGKLGGTIFGILQNLPYLEELGVNTIYLNPIFMAGEYHKYDLLDYFHIDPCFGTNDEFESLVRDCHNRKIRVIIDGVFNHCGWNFFAFEDVVQNGEASVYKDWFYNLQFPVIRPANPEEYPNYECFGYERMMPKLNTTNPEVVDYFCKVARFWIEEFDIDGWRLDVASEVDDAFWRRFHKEVKEAKKDAILIGEVWETANHWLDGTIFDSTMNYDFRKHCKRFFAERSIDAKQFDGRVTDMRLRYREQTVYAQLNVLDTHDVTRFLSVCKENETRAKLAVVFQMTFLGMPSIFYGDELGITGILEEEYRQGMPWGKSSIMFDFYKSLIALRKQEVVLRRGKYRTILADSNRYVYGFERYDDTERIGVFINMEEQSVPLTKKLLQGQILLSEGLSGEELSAGGYAIIKYEG